jgi:hypothetical protein
VEKFDELLIYFEHVLNHYLEIYAFNGIKRNRKYSPKAERFKSIEGYYQKLST